MWRPKKGIFKEEVLDVEIIRMNANAAAYDSTWQLFSPDGAMPEDGMRLVIDDAKNAIKLNRPVAIAEVADASALRDPQRMLGIMAH